MSKDATGAVQGRHAVKFYESPESLCHIVAEFLAEGLALQHVALIIGTPEHRAGIVAELRARHFDVDELQAAGDLLILDAAETLTRFMVDGSPDAQQFNDTLTLVIEQLCRGRKDCTIRAYGEMVDLLWKAGQDVAAIRLEMLWSKLVMSRKFSLLCGYAMGTFFKDADVAAIHHHHSHAVSAEGVLVPLLPRTTAS